MDKYSVNPTFKFSEEDILDIISSAIYDVGYWGDKKQAQVFYLLGFYSVLLAKRTKNE